jgi:acylphosphatase
VSPGDARAVRAVVHGRVQGVFFRDSTRREAQRLGVAGWVRNRPDGTVELHAEGPPDAVEALLAFARTGPPNASVERVDAVDAKPEGVHGFDVR